MYIGPVLSSCMISSPGNNFNNPGSKQKSSGTADLANYHILTTPTSCKHSYVIIRVGVERAGNYLQPSVEYKYGGRVLALESPPPGSHNFCSGCGRGIS